jgi:hypothetical protein
VAVYLGQVGHEDRVDPRDVPQARSPDDGLVRGTQAQDLLYYGVPVPFNRLNGRAQATLVLCPPRTSPPRKTCPPAPDR